MPLPFIAGFRPLAQAALLKSAQSVNVNIIIIIIIPGVDEQTTTAPVCLTHISPSTSPCIPPVGRHHCKRRCLLEYTCGREDTWFQLSSTRRYTPCIPVYTYLQSFTDVTSFASTVSTLERYPAYNFCAWVAMQIRIESCPTLPLYPFCS